MNAYRVTIYMQDGSCGQHHGLYKNDWDAIDRALSLFPESIRVFLRRIK